MFRRRNLSPSSIELGTPVVNEKGLEIGPNVLHGPT